MIGRLLRRAARNADNIIDLDAPVDYAMQDARSEARAFARMRAERPRGGVIDLGGNHNALREELARYIERQRNLPSRSRLSVLADRPQASAELDTPEAPLAELVVLLENALRRRGAARDMMPAQMGAIAGAGAAAIPGSLMTIDALERMDRERAKRERVPTADRLMDEWWREFEAAQEGFQPFQPRSGVSLDFHEPQSDPFQRLRARTTGAAERQKRARRRMNRRNRDWLYDPGPEGWR